MKNYSNLRAKKSLGQNFLQDRQVLVDILKVGEVKIGEVVLEIGPGKGVLTEQLLNKGVSVIAVEKDPRMVELLRNKFFTYREFHLIEGDILDLDLSETLKKYQVSSYKLIANIPYYITGKILRMFLETDSQPELVVLLTQKEVAKRVCQKEGKLTILALSVQLFGQPELTRIVSREAFDPVPKVDSAILKITPHLESIFTDLESQKEFFRLIKIGFASPRKKLLNNLSAGLQLPKEQLMEILQRLNLSQTVRPAELTIPDWQKLMKELA